MKQKPRSCWKIVIVASCALAATIATHAQVNTNPVPNLTISWDLNQDGFANAAQNGGQPVPNTPAGLALATNWNDGWEENSSSVSGVPPITVNNLFDSTGTAISGLNLTYAAWNGYAANGYSSRPPQDADGSYNMQMLNGYLNAGPAAWSPNITNSYVTITNIPYTNYDVVIYVDCDTSGRHFRVSDGTSSYYASTLGGLAEVGGANALFMPTTQTNSGQFPGADFAFFPGETSSSNRFDCYPMSGNDQWLGIAGFQIIQASNVYVLYGAYPASQIVPVGQPASFKVMAGGLNPTYQWQHAGANILNATNSAYTIAATALGQDGNYSVVVSNSFSSVTSAVATLTFYTPKTVEWDGNGSTWDTSSLFWTVNGGASTTGYTQTDNALFDPLGAAQSTVTLSGSLMPSSVTVSNASYTLTSGSLAGSGSLHVKNNGSLILDTADNRTGPTVIDNGSLLQLDNGDTAGSLGSGALTNNGAFVFDANGNVAYGFPIYGTGNITNNGGSGLVTLASDIADGYLVQAGSGSMLLQGSNSLTGGLVVSGGTLEARAPYCLASNTIITGGTLQLIFNIDYAGGNILLNGGVLEGGVNGSDAYEGTITLGMDSTINVDGGNTLTLNNGSGIAANGFNLTFGGGGGTLVLAGTNNTWNSVSIGLGTLQIGKGVGGSLGAGSISDSGTLAFDVAANLTVTNPVTGGGLINQIGSGEIVFTGDLSGIGGAIVSSGALGGITTIGGPVVVAPGATLAPGTPSAIGTLTLNSDLNIGGNIAVKVNKSLSQSNDLISVAGALNNTNSGTVTVNNLGSALAVGDKFTLFSQPVAGGNSLAVTGSGAVWSNNLVNDGSVIVLSTTIPKPVIRTFSVSGGNVVISGTNGPASHAYRLLSSTNLTIPLVNWTSINTNNYDGSGNFNITNPVGAAPQNFYILQSQ